MIGGGHHPARPGLLIVVGVRGASGIATARRLAPASRRPIVRLAAKVM